MEIPFSFSKLPKTDNPVFVTGEFRSIRWPFFRIKQCIAVLKAGIRQFLSNFYFTPIDSHYEKCFIVHLKSSFCSRDILLYFSLIPIFLPVSHCFRGWSNKNVKVYDVINCLKNNLMAHFVWYLEKEKRCDIETLSNDRVLSKEHFYGKIMLKICSKS